SRRQTFQLGGSQLPGVQPAPIQVNIALLLAGIRQQAEKAFQGMCQRALKLAAFSFEILARQVHLLQGSQGVGAHKEHRASKKMRVVDSSWVKAGALGQGDQMCAGVLIKVFADRQPILLAAEQWM